MTVKRLIGSAPSQVSRNRDLGTMAFQDVSLVKGPVFHATRTSGVQTFAATTWTKLQYNNEVYDTANCYDNSTNYRFTPNVAGYYFIGGGGEFNNVAGTATISIQKNGGEVIRGATGGTTAGTFANVNGVVFLNGSTDYVEMWAYTSTNMNGLYNGSISVFYGFLIRGV